MFLWSYFPVVLNTHLMSSDQSINLVCSLCSLPAGRDSAPLQYLLSVLRGSVAFLPGRGAGVVREFRGFGHDLRRRGKTPS